MQIYILRHGIAEENSATGNDADRNLTPEGRQRLQHVLRLAEKDDVLPTVILTSPLNRAVQTAEVAIDVLGYSEDLLRTNALSPFSDPETVWTEIREHQGIPQLLLVGHEPLLSRLVAHLLGAPSMTVDMRKGALVRIDMEKFGPEPRGVLRWMVTPKLAV
jgi:phosphohistidine phosphatase